MDSTHSQKRRRPLRLKDYDYSIAGAYFVTICTAERQALFGNIRGGQMVCNAYGKIVDGCWAEIPDHFPGVEVDAFVVMPNHVHGIIIINDIVGATHASPLPEKGSDAPAGARHTGARHTGARHASPLRHSLGTIVGGFKSASTRKIRMIRKERQLPVWQRNYYEHVIRDENSLYRIREYIATNPLRWEMDRENLEGTGKDEFDQWLAGVKTAPRRGEARRGEACLAPTGGARDKGKGQ